MARIDPEMDDLKRNLEAVNRELRDLQRSSKDLTDQEKAEVAAKKDALQTRRDDLKEDIGERKEIVQGREAISSTVGGIAASAFRGLADPMMTNMEMASQVGKTAGAAVGEISLAGFKIGAPLGSLIGEMAPDVQRSVMEAAGIPGAETAMAAMTKVRDVLSPVMEAQAERRYIEGSAASGGGSRLRTLADAGVNITPDMAEAIMKPYLKQARRRFEADVEGRKAIDKLGTDGKD